MTSPTFFPANSYVALVQDGHCKICGMFGDLRYGSCFSCSEFVDGKLIPGGHELWDTRNPRNRWRVVADQ